MSKGLFIGEVCRRAECTSRTVRFYEEKGLLSPVAKTSGGKKLYPPEAVSIIRMVQVLAKVGYSIADVQELLQLSQSTDTKERRLTLQLRQILQRTLHSLDAKITELTFAREEIGRIISKTRVCEECGSEDCSGCGKLSLLRTLGFLTREE